MDFVNDRFTRNVMLNCSLGGVHIITRNEISHGNYINKSQQLIISQQHIISINKEHVANNINVRHIKINCRFYKIGVNVYVSEIFLANV